MLSSSAKMTGKRRRDGWERVGERRRCRVSDEPQMPVEHVALHSLLFPGRHRQCFIFQHSVFLFIHLSHLIPCNMSPIYPLSASLPVSLFLSPCLCLSFFLSLALPLSLFVSCSLSLSLSLGFCLSSYIFLRLMLFLSLFLWFISSPLSLSLSLSRAHSCSLSLSLSLSVSSSLPLNTHTCSSIYCLLHILSCRR